MNENDKYNSSTSTSYRATNLNTAIGNPNININDPMNMNIKTMATNSVTNDSQGEANNNYILNNNQNTNYPNTNSQVPNIVNNTINVQQNYSTNLQNGVRKTYVTTDNRPKKKNLAINIGSEFKIAILIIVILLVFVFLLPMLSEMLFGY